MKNVLVITAAVAASVAASVGAVVWMDAAQEREVQARIAAEQALRADAKSRAQLFECNDVIAQVEAGNRAYAERTWGASADAAIETCRAIIDLDAAMKR